MALLGASGLTACNQPPSQAALATVDTVGVIATRTAAERSVLFRLEDGREVEAGTPDIADRWGSGGGPGDLLLAGGSATGRWVSTVDRYDPAPIPGCFWLTSVGVNRGDAVEVLGARLPKASAFSTTIHEPPVGEPYEGNGYFCLDRSGSVTGYVD
jgi:hypothetical protein